jgi:hypothetical protein
MMLSCARASVCAIALAAAILSGIAPLSGDEPEPLPTPADWEQWQPQIDFADTRLAPPFSMWEKEIDLQDVLARLSAASGAEMTTAPELGGVEVSVFVGKGTVSGVMLMLAELYAGYWCYPRGQSPTERRYYLVPAALPEKPTFDRFQKMQRRAWMVEHAPWREEREKALRLHREALSLSPEDLIERYGESDPWLCVNVLSPQAKPLVEYACSLEGEELEELLTYGRLDYRPIRRFPQAVREHLLEQIRAEDEGGGLYAEEYLFGSRPKRFETAQERRANTSVSVEWRDPFLVLQAYVPDTGMTNWTALTSESVRDAEPAAEAQSRLLRMGYGDDSPERQAQLREEVIEWYRNGPRPEEILSDPSKWSEHDLYRKLGLVEDPNTGDPRLSKPLDLTGLEGARMVGVDILQEVARQCEVGVVADYNHIPYPVQMGKAELLKRQSTVGDTLARIRGIQGGGISYNFRGAYLVVSYPGVRTDRNPGLAPELEAALRETFQPGVSVDVGRAAALLGQLDRRQLSLVCGTVLGVSPISDRDTWRDLARVQGYGGFTEDQRERLLAGGTIAFSELDGDQRNQVLTRAKSGWRRWLTMPEMANTVIRAERREGDDGRPCLGVIYEYNFDESPKDRDVTVVPLQVLIPSDPGEAETSGADGEAVDAPGR